MFRICRRDKPMAWTDKTENVAPYKPVRFGPEQGVVQGSDGRAPETTTFACARSQPLAAGWLAEIERFRAPPTECRLAQLPPSKMDRRNCQPCAN